jgi:hypothetical protein
MKEHGVFIGKYCGIIVSGLSSAQTNCKSMQEFGERKANHILVKNGV